MNIIYIYTKKMRNIYDLFSFYCLHQFMVKIGHRFLILLMKGRHHPITFSNDNYGFVVAGSYSNEVYKYDKLNDSWSQLSNFPLLVEDIHMESQLVIKSYMGLGSTFNGSFPNDWWEYNMDNDTWDSVIKFFLEMEGITQQ